MRNLKRALSLALASVMLLGMMVVGTSAKGLDDFSDAADIVNEDAVAVTAALGIFDGYEDGEFKPENVVTRAEMAVIIAKILYGGDVNVEQFKDQKVFTDVPDWAEGYVNLCASLGIVAGVGNGKFDPNSTVTTAQAALMLCRAVGYFQNDAELGDNWILAATAKASSLKMYGNLNLSATAGLTRDNVAEMVFNTLTKACTVEYNSTFGMYYTTGTEWTAGVEFDYTETLGYKNFDLVYKDDDKDDFGRPCTIWGIGTLKSNATDDDGDLISDRVNISDANKIISAVNDPETEWTSKVTQEALYDATGSSYMKEKDYDWEVYVDGDQVEDFNPADIDKDEDDKDFLNGNGDQNSYEVIDGNNITGNGVLTQLFFVDGQESDDKDKVVVTVIRYYAAEVYKVDGNTVQLSDLDNGPAETSDEFETELALEEDDIVYYTWSYDTDEIQSIALADKLEGEVTRVRMDGSNGDNFTVDGTTYSYNKTVSKNDSRRLISENVDNDVVAYLDAYGYVIYIDDSAVTYDYAYVLSVGHDTAQYGGSNTYYARLILTDGTMVKAELDNKNAESLKNHIVSYSVDKDDVYTLSDKSNAAIERDKNLEISSGTAGMKIGFNGSNRYTANSKTVFIITDSDDDLDDYDIAVYTGINNVPDVDGDSSTKVCVATDGNSSLAKVVYIEDGDVSGDGDVIFARADTNAKLVKDSENGNYYEINAIDTEGKTTLNVKDSSTGSAYKNLVGSTAGEDGVQVTARRTIVALKSTTENSDDQTTGAKLYDAYDSASGDGYLTGTGTGKAENETIQLIDVDGSTSLDNDRWTYADDVLVVRYSMSSGSFSASRVSSIKDDADDQFIAVFDEDVMIGICIIEVDDNHPAYKDTNTYYTASITVNGKTVASQTKLLDGASYSLEYTVPAGVTVKDENSKEYKAGEKITFAGTIAKADATMALTSSENGSEVTVTNDDKLEVEGDLTITSEKGTTLTIAAKTGYEIKSVTCAAATITEVKGTYVVAIPADTAAVTVTVEVEAIDYTVSAGTGITVGSNTVNVGDKLDIKVEADEAGATGNDLAVYINDVEVGKLTGGADAEAATYEFVNVATDEATFNAIKDGVGTVYTKNDDGEFEEATWENSTVSLYKMTAEAEEAVAASFDGKVEITEDMLTSDTLSVTVK